jgi:protein-S-isoprenylcysteine O-methyltransferase Ste14
MLFLRALLAFLVLPGLVAFLVPALIVSRSALPLDFSFLGASVFAVGLFALLWCVASFYVSGKGTLAPWSPPSRLVTVGLYRFTRNPMYLSVLLVLVGWALLFRSLDVVLYAVFVALAFHLRVVFGEEPWLSNTHGLAWRRYAQSVPRWLWRFTRKPLAGNGDA